MDVSKYRKRIDLYITLVLTYFFILTMTFNYLSLTNKFENYIMVTILMIVATISYYTNITVALIMAIVIDFIYASYKIYLNYTMRIEVDFSAYYWLILIPITGILIANLAKDIMLNQEEVKKLEKQNKELIMIDEETGIRNSSAFFNEMPIYMSMSMRYNLPVNLLLVRFKYKDKVSRLIGEENFKKIFIKTSDTISEALRYEDRKYILDEDTFAFIIIAEEAGCKIVKDRLKEKILNMTVSRTNKIHKQINVEVNIAYYPYNKDVKDVFEFVELVEKELDYDV